MPLSHRANGRSFFIRMATFGLWVIAGASSTGATDAASLETASGQQSAKTYDWVMLAGPPRDLVDREMPPGLDGAWCYIPELQGFLLYGGCSPRFTNEGWLFAPASDTWRLLWPDDSLRYDSKTGRWRVLRPSQIIWSHDRPGPARGRAMVYVPEKGLIYLFGGFPNKRREWFGKTKVGTWALDPKTLTFRYISSDGPRGLTRGVYDSKAKRIVAAPERSQKREGSAVTWVFDPATETWEARRSDPAPRASPHPAFTFDERIGQSVYFSEYGETWTYDALSNRWTRRKPAQSPPPRRHAGMCFHPRLGVSILHGGIHHLSDGGKPWSRHSHDAFRSSRKELGVQYNDTWSYNAVTNEWKRLDVSHRPPAVASPRGCFAYDPTRSRCVLYDPAIGCWAYGSSDVARSGRPDDVKTVVDDRVVPRQETLARRATERTKEARLWQTRLKSLKDDAWLDTQLGKPTQGCLNFEYDAANRCLVWIGGCNGAVFSTYEQYSYNNQVILLDMDTGTWYQRRANHVWDPAFEAYIQCRPGNGCGRALCYDATRKTMWTLGGVTSIGFAGTRGLQSYDVGTDRFSPAFPSIPGYGANCGLVHDPIHDVLVAAAGQYKDICATHLFDLKTKRWRPAAPHPPKFSLYTRILFDRQVGVLMITMLPKQWKLGDPIPQRPGDDLTGYAMRTFAYDVGADRWSDLAPENEHHVPVSDLPGLAYDSRNRVIIMVENPAREAGYRAPRRRRQVWILDLEENTWKQGTSTPPMQGINKCSLVYDPNHNVVICGERNRIYLYRYRGGCPEDAFVSSSPRNETSPNR